MALYNLKSFKDIKGREKTKYIHTVFSIYPHVYHLLLSVIHIVTWYHSPSASWTSFSISSRTGLLATHPLNPCWFANIIIFPSFLKDSFAGYRILFWQCIRQHSECVTFPCLLPFVVSEEKLALITQCFPVGDVIFFLLLLRFCFCFWHSIVLTILCLGESVFVFTYLCGGCWTLQIYRWMHAGS